MTHTPGPWTLRDDRLSPQVWVEAVTGATRIVRFGPRENWDAIDHGNANLIAAAPDLLDALVRAEQMIRILVLRGVFRGDCVETAENEAANFRALVMKAKGRPPKKEQ